MGIAYGLTASGAEAQGPEFSPQVALAIKVSHLVLDIPLQL